MSADPPRIARPLVLDRIAMARLRKKDRARVELLAQRAERLRSRWSRWSRQHRVMARREFASIHWALERLGLLVLEAAHGPFFAQELQKDEGKREGV